MKWECDTKAYNMEDFVDSFSYEEVRLRTYYGEQPFADDHGLV